MGANFKDGRVISVDARGALVDVAGEPLFCRVRGRFYEDLGQEKRPVAPGDEVKVVSTAPGEGVIEEIAPRRTKLSRPSGHHGDQEQVVAANVDRLAIIVSTKRPPLRQGLIDRLIIAATNHRIDPFVVINKIDLGRARKVAEIRAVYERLGYAVVLTSAKEEVGIEDLRAEMKDRTTVLAGHSGVGKSSLLNLIEPSLALRVGKVSHATSRGRHTTTRAKLLPLHFGGYAVDTPGVRAFGLWDLDKADLDIFFREFEPLIEQCRFHNCLHDSEPSCAVRDAVEAGDLRVERYEAYLRILSTLER